MITEIIAIDAITDDRLKAIGHHEDCRVQLSDAAVLTTALVAARFFKRYQSGVCLALAAADRQSRLR